MNEAAAKLSGISTITLTAKRCMWFAWVPSGSFTGPEGESGSEYRPFQLDVSDVISVKVKQVSGTWAHSPNEARLSGANGLDGSGLPPLPNDSRSLENNAYQSATYDSENIQKIDTNLNKLVGMIGVNSDTSSSQFIVGSYSEIAIPVGAKWLFLAFHDGRQWTNNRGGVSIELNINSDSAPQRGSGAESSDEG